MQRRRVIFPRLDEKCWRMFPKAGGGGVVVVRGRREVDNVSRQTSGLGWSLQPQDHQFEVDLIERVIS